jgi:hypothetical protein
MPVASLLVSLHTQTDYADIEAVQPHAGVLQPAAVGHATEQA